MKKNQDNIKVFTENGILVKTIDCAKTLTKPDGIAVNPAGANLFIDFMLRPDIGAMLTEQSGYTTVVESALDMTKGIDKDLYRFTDVQLKELKWLPNLSQDVRSAYVEFWEEIISVQ